MARTAHDKVWLNTKGTKLFYGVLCRLSLDLMSSSNIRNKAHVNNSNVACATLFSKLANCLNKRLRLNITNSATKLCNDYIGISNLFNASKTSLNCISYMRNYLNCTTKEVSSALTLNQRLINEASGEVRLPGKVLINKALIMTKVKVSLFTVLSDKNLTMLERTHSAWVNVKIWVSFLHHDLIATSLKKSAERCSSDSFSKRGNNATCYKYVLGHGLLP